MSEYTRSGDRDAEPLVQWSRSYWIETCFDRAEKLKQCPSGLTGACCRICHMGPCRFYQSGEERIDKGVCGASLAVVVARNILRMAAAGASAFTDTARVLVNALSNAASGKTNDFRIKDIHKLHYVAGTLGVDFEGRPPEEVSRDVALRLLNEFSIHSAPPAYLKRAPAATLRVWKEAGLIPSGTDRDIVSAMHSTTIGVNQDPVSLLTAALRVSAAGCWVSAMMACDVSDILFGRAENLRFDSGLGLFRDDEVNIVFIGHDPALLELIMEEVSGAEMTGYARSKGASGIRLGILSPLRHGSGIAGGFSNQELCMITGLVDAVVAGIQNVMPSLPDIANSFHTKIITTSKEGQLPGAMHVEYDPLNAREGVRDIIGIAIENYPNRTGNGERVYNRHSSSSPVFPDLNNRAENGASGEFRKKLVNALNGNRIKGIACLIGPDNPRIQATGAHRYLIEELVSDDILVLTTEGGSAASAVSGLLDPEKALSTAGQSLKEACSELGILPVIHVGGSTDISRMLGMFASIVSEDGPFDSIRKMPAVVIAPEWFAEKDLTAALGFAASGIPVIMGGPSPVGSSEEVTKIMSLDWEERFGGPVVFEPDFRKMLETALDYVKRRRDLINAGSPEGVDA